MQRNVDDGRILFHKKGGGSFRTVNGRIIKPNQKFRAHPEEIPEAFRARSKGCSNRPSRKYIVKFTI